MSAAAAILGVKPLPNVSLPRDRFRPPPPPEGEWSVLVLGETQILGGGRLSPNEKGMIDVHEVWAVADLDGAHWAKLIPDVDLYVCHPMIASCARSTIIRFTQAGQVAVQREVDRRAGLEAAIRVITQELRGTDGRR